MSTKPAVIVVYQLTQAARMLAYNIAAELAGAREDVKGPASFRTALIDACYIIDAQTVEERARLEFV